MFNQWRQWRVLFWNFYIFNISLRSISVCFGDINSLRLLKMFALVTPGHLRQFFVKMVHITHCYPVHISPKRLILLVPGFLWEKLLFMARNSFILSVIAVDVVSFFYFFAGIIFYSFSLALMPSYRASRFFKLIAWTTSNVEQRLEFGIGWLISNTYIAKVL